MECLEVIWMGDRVFRGGYVCLEVVIECLEMVIE